MATTKQASDLDRYVKIGVDWLLHSAQPDDAWTQHHGVIAPEAVNLRLRFVPAGANGRPVVVVDRAHWAYVEVGDGTVDNPLTDTEMERVVEALAGAGVTIADSWNGPPAITGSFALGEVASLSLLAAVSRYRAGCPDHGGSVFCSRPSREQKPCDWYSRGHAKMVLPDWTTP